MDQPHNTRVMIVEDDFLVSEMVENMLLQAGFEVVHKAPGAEKICALIADHKPDVIIMDIEMPGMNGIQAIARIFASCPTPVVILTAYETSRLVEQASEAGAGAYLVKPPNIHELKRSISIAVARFRDMLKLKQLNQELHRRNQQLQEALAEVKTLKGLLPICASCKKVRDDDGYWQQVEVYIATHTDVIFAHSLCPKCAKKYYNRLFTADSPKDENLN